MTITAMEAHLYDLTKITFTDPSVERFAKMLDSSIKTNQNIISDFATRLASRPFEALENSYGVKLAAARLGEAQSALNDVLDTVLNGADQTWAVMKLDLVQQLTEALIYGASNPPRSTNTEANDMASFALRAKSEMLDRIVKGRF